MQLTKQDLLEVFNEDTIQASTYIIQARTLIRLINTNPIEASIPALYPNTKEYRNALKKLSNVNFRVNDTKEGKVIKNTKTDMEIIVNSPKLPTMLADEGE